MLSSVNDPTLRCPALWWAHILPGEVHDCCDPKTLGLLARQWHLLRSRWEWNVTLDFDDLPDSAV